MLRQHSVSLLDFCPVERVTNECPGIGMVTFLHMLGHELAGNRGSPQGGATPQLGFPRDKKHSSLNGRGTVNSTSQQVPAPGIPK